MALPTSNPVRDWTTATPAYPPPSFGHSASGPASPAAHPDWSVTSSTASLPSAPPLTDSPDQPRARALQIQNRYLVTETEEGLVIVDQHALHERVIYEQLREKILAGKLESQQLLVPEPVPLAP
ncbi:MAG: hypothetical protein GY819_07125, partial [Planctomycetaceae bacterium]|nr:hypothetical protein [Planctomycetaceae bacterium]